MVLALYRRIRLRPIVLSYRSGAPGNRENVPDRAAGLPAGGARAVLPVQGRRRAIRGSFPDAVHRVPADLLSGRPRSPEPVVRTAVGSGCGIRTAPGPVRHRAVRRAAAGRKNVPGSRKFR